MTFTSSSPRATAKAASAAAAKLREAGGKVDFLQLDVSDPESIRQVAAEYAQASESLDVLINNAGILLPEDNSILNLTAEMLTEVMTTNTFAALRMTQAFQPLLEKSPAPRVINVSSGGGQLADGADGWAPAYCISKTSLNGVTSQLAVALPKFAINSVCPGWVRTDLGGSNAPRSLAEGADGIVWLAAEAPQDLTSQFLRDRKVIPW